MPSDDPSPEIVQEALDAYTDAALVSELRLVGLRCERPNLASTELNASDQENDRDDNRQSPSRELVGFLVAESFDEPLPSDVDDRLIRISGPAAQALGNAIHHERTPLRWATRWVHDFSRSARWLMAGLIALLGLIGVLIFVQVPKSLTANGQTFPEIRRHVFVPTDSVVREIHVRDGQVVDEGDLLVSLHSPDLVIQQQDLRGQLDIKRQELATVRTRRTSLGEASRRGDNASGSNAARQQLDELSSQEKLLSLEIEHLDAQIEIVGKRLGELKLISETAGVVAMSVPPESIMGRPVSRGQILMDTYDPDSAWLADVMVEQQDIASLLLAAREPTGSDSISASVGLVAAPERVVSASIDKIASQASMDQQVGAPVLRVRLAIPDGIAWPLVATSDKTNPTPASGLAVRAQIHVGSQSLCEYLFRGTVTWLRDQIRFRTGVVPLVVR